MIHNFTDPISGRTCTTPWSVDDAIANGRYKYMDRDGCTKCGTDHPKTRYVDGGDCVGCFTKHEMEVFNLWMQGLPNRPKPFCISAVEAIKAGQDWHFTLQVVCDKGPHFLRRHVKTGRCLDCDEYQKRVRMLARGPRAIARAEGRGTYLPIEPCPECEMCSPRNVVTNACMGWCSSQRKPRGRPSVRPDIRNQPPAPAPKHDGRRTPTSIMVEMCPEMIISRNDARAAGFTQYRTGDACRRGHTGWRYVSVGTCIQCARGER